MSKITFNNSNALLFGSLKEKVNAYFAQSGRTKTKGSKLFIKSLFVAISLLTIYVILVFYTPAALPALIFCALFGCNLAFIGF